MRLANFNGAGQHQQQRLTGSQQQVSDNDISIGDDFLQET